MLVFEFTTMLSNQQKIQHLSWRAGFGLSPREYKKMSNLTVGTVLERLFKDARNIPELAASDFTFRSKEERKSMSDEERKAMKKMGKNSVFELNTNWMERMASPDYNPLLEKMTLFWHGHFACELKLPHFAAIHLNTIRRHALGNFRDLVLAIAKDPSMLNYLDNRKNKKEQPNENFARELMELFTIGRGNYTEQDIKESARAFTGWGMTPQGEFLFKSRQHDYGQKTFMGKTGNFDGTDIIDMILERRETAEYIATKVYRYFVNDRIDKAHIRELADVFYTSNYDIELLMRTLFASDWFYDKKNIGVRIKSPVELLAGMMRTLDMRFEDRKPMITLQKALGQVLFRPPNVAGWSGGKTWIDNATLMLRLNLATILFESKEADFNIKAEPEKEGFKKISRIKVQANIQPVIAAYKNMEEEEIFEALSNYVLQTKHPIDRAVIDMVLRKESKEAYITSLLMRLMSMPEYQMC